MIKKRFWNSVEYRRFTGNAIQPETVFGKVLNPIKSKQFQNLIPNHFKTILKTIQISFHTDQLKTNLTRSETSIRMNPNQVLNPNSLKRIRGQIYLD